MDEKSTNFQRGQMPKPVIWTGYESLRTEHATHLVVQSHGTELTLLFFEFQPPLRLVPQKSKQLRLKNYRTSKQHVLPKW